jgi:hypothetical protein
MTVFLSAFLDDETRTSGLRRRLAPIEQIAGPPVRADRVLPATEARAVIVCPLRRKDTLPPFEKTSQVTLLIEPPAGAVSACTQCKERREWSLRFH